MTSRWPGTDGTTGRLRCMTKAPTCSTSSTCTSSSTETSLRSLESKARTRVPLKQALVDARVLWNTYLNGLGFKMHMADVWQPIISKWNSIARMTLEDGSTPLKPLADIFLNWADIVRYGFKPGNDAVLNTAHAVLNTLIP